MAQWAIHDKPTRPIIYTYEPEAGWLWTRWKGTVLSLTFWPIVVNICVGIGVDVAVHSASESSWGLLTSPPVYDPIVEELHGLNSLWEYLGTLTTFILTFFTAEAYRYWRSVYATTRAIQGRIQDICMLVTMGSQLDNSESQELAMQCTRLIKVR